MEHQFAYNGGERETKHTFIKADYLEDRLLTPRQTAEFDLFGIIK